MITLRLYIAFIECQQTLFLLILIMEVSTNSERNLRKRRRAQPLKVY